MGFPAARVGDSTVHGPPILGPGCPTVLIGNRPAWRLGGDTHTCPLINAPPPAGPGTPHLTGFATMGSFTVMIGNMPAVRMGDMITEPGAIIPFPPINPIISGEFTVLIGGPTVVMSVNPITGNCSCNFSPNISIEGSPEFVALTLRDLGKLNATPTGKKLLESINTNKGGHKVKIIESTGGNTENAANWNNGLYDRTNNKPGPGSDSTVEYNPHRTKLDGENWMERDPAVGLGHELIHADHDAKGTTDDRALDYIDLNGNKRNAPGYEQQAVGLGKYSGNDFTENKLRSDFGETQRPHY